VRERLTLAFVGLALVIIVVAGAVRSMTLGDIVHASETEDLQQQALAVGRVVEQLDRAGRPVDTGSLADLVPPHVRLVVDRPGTADVVVEGTDYDETSPDIRAASTAGGVTVTMVQDETVADDVLAQTRNPLIVLLVGLVALAAVLGLVIASALARPFRELAESAAALGRGRFDIEPPRSRIPEVVSISDSLRASSLRLQTSLRRDRDFFHHASHVLRTPLTGMRLELEELTLRRDLDEDVRRTTARCLSDVERLDRTIAELLDFARGRALVEGAEVSLLALGSQIAQRWRGRLPESREVKAFVDCGPELLLTPGPVEQLLDSVLRDVCEAGTGPVMIRFAGQDEHVRVTVRSGSPAPYAASSGSVALAAGVRTNADVARTITEALGGRYTGDATLDQLEILLPRR
jgi:signal transduction histidine kinase